MSAENIMQMRVSVVIPVFNRAEKVLGAIGSVLAQTHPADEILVVDDGSSDGSAEAVIAAFPDAVRVIRQPNRGPSAARNAGVQSASGDWIAFLDSDDRWLPQKLARQCAVLGRFYPQARVCFTDNLFAGDANLRHSVFAAAAFDAHGEDGLLSDAGLMIAEEREPFYTSSILVERALLLDAGGFDPAVMLREDSDLFFRLSLRTKFCYAAQALVTVDRDPQREHGLCELYATRDKRKSASLERVYGKWMQLDGVHGSHYAQPVHRLLARTYWNALSDRLHDGHWREALCKLKHLCQLEGGLLPLMHLLMQKVLRRVRGGRR